MSRGIRIAYSGATYHVYSRGVRRSAVYRSDEDYQSYLEDLALLSQKHGAKVLAFCLMPNHPHLCLRTEGDPISVVMQRLNQRLHSPSHRKHRSRQNSPDVM